jgi:glycerate-2-kinase
MERTRKEEAERWEALMRGISESTKALLEKMEQNRREEAERAEAFLKEMERTRKEEAERLENLIMEIRDSTKAMLERMEREARETHRFMASLIKGEAEDVKSLIKDLIKEKEEKDYG